MVKLKIQVALMIVVVFVLGVFTGTRISRANAARALSDISEGPPELAQGRMMSHMLARRLHLSREQRASVRQIFDKHAKEFVDIRASQEPEAARVREQIKTEIAVLLDEKQRAELARLELEMATRREKMGIGGGHGGPRHRQERP